MLYPGHFLEPNEIAMLARVAETIGSERGVAPKSPERERLAAQLLKLFMNGLAGEDELLDAERNRARRQRTTVSKLSGSDIVISESA